MFRKRFRTLLAEESGAVAPLALLLLPVLLGFCALVLDVGIIYSNRRFLQNAADAGALAGAREFQLGILNGTGESDSQAAAAASAFAGKNGVSNVVADCPSNGAATFITNARGPLQHSWKVETGRLVHLYFGGWVGVPTQCVHAQAVAVVTELQGTKLWPWGLLKNAYDQFISSPTYHAGDTVSLKEAAQGSTNGNFGVIDFTCAGGGSTQYKNWVYNGYGTPGSGETIPIAVPPGPWNVCTNTGNKSNVNKDLDTYVEQQQKLTCPPDIRCPIVGLIPLVSEQSWPTGNSGTVNIVRFAVFQLEDICFSKGNTGVCDNNGGTGQMIILGKFLTVAAGVGPTFAPSPSGELIGLIGVRLWQ
jgi:Flp pilus assembly protein TadG